MRVYEGLIIFDSKDASTGWDALKAQVIEILKRYGGEVLRERKWSDRKLSHDVKGVKRGTYLLVHFVAEPGAITKIRADLRLSEPVLRELIVRLDLTKEAFLAKMEAAGPEADAVPIEPIEEEPEAADEDSEASDRSGPRRPSRTDEVKV